MKNSIIELLQKEAQAVLNIPVTDAFEEAVNLIVEQVHLKKGKLVTSGMGKAGQIAMNIATTFFIRFSPNRTLLFQRKRKPRSISASRLLAAGEGFEPSHTESESAVLPLHNPAVS